MTAQERVDAIREAQVLILEGIELLKGLDPDFWAMHYLIAPLEIVVSAGHGWRSSNANLDDWMAQILRKEEAE